MPKTKISWQPRSYSIGDYRYSRITDGDTPFIEVSIRMLSIEAPEVHYPGETKPYKHDEKLKELGERLKNGAFSEIPDKLRKYLIERLDDHSGTRQYTQGLWSSDHFLEMIEKELYPRNRAARKLFLIGSGDRFDQHGRVLAYITKKLTKKELEETPKSKRKTFNLMLVEEGWAASFPVYPSLPGIDDFEMLRSGAERAREEKKGIWQDPKTLLGYEFRMCVKLLKQNAKIDDYLPRFCADVTTKKLYKPENYLEVLPENRLFIWRKDVDVAREKLGLLDA